MRNVLMDEQHDPATMDIYVFSIYTIRASFREEFWSCNRTVDFGFLDSYNIWLMKVKEIQQFQILPLMQLIFMLMNFNPPIKLLLFVPQGEDLSFFSFVRGETYFQFPSSPVHQRRNQKKWRIHISGKSMYSLYCSQFHTEFLQWMKIHYGYHNCHTELHCDPLGQHHCKDHSQLYSLYNTKLRHQIQFLRVRCHQGWAWSVEAFLAFLILKESIRCLTVPFLHKPHWNLGPGFISI